MYIRLGVHADEKIVDSERELIRLIGRPFEDIIHIDAFTSMCSGYFKPEEYEDLAKTSELDTVLGDAFARLMLCFMAVDGEICRSEEETFRKTFREFAEQLESYDDLGGSELYRALMEE